MPAMSPTMTEGNIASWKIQEGQSFNAGDVLLEIETDKAQMDVEAQDDGVLAKIVIPDGSKNVKVGKTIAMLAEQGDDLSTVEVPKEDDAPEADGEAKTKKNQKSSSDSASKSAGEKDHILGSYPPAVLRLFQQFRIEDPSVIRPTGPQGRILKGDVLAYAGKIGKQVPQVLNEILIKKQKLDLTNIQIQKPQRAQVASPSVHRPKAPPEPSKLMAMVRVRQLLRVQGKLSEFLGVSLTIESLVRKASELALKDVPTFGLRRKSEADVLFEELLGRPSSWSESIRPSGTSENHPDSGEPLAAEDLAQLFSSTITPPTLGKTLLRFEPVETDNRHSLPSADVFDVLLGHAPRHRAPTKSTLSSENVRMRLEYDDTMVNPESAAAYLERLRFHIESPGLAVI